MLRFEITPSSHDIIARAGETIRNGGLVAFPTETVYGLGADAENPTAVSKIYIAKGRPSDNPLINHANSLDSFAHLVDLSNEHIEKLAAKFWPGPLTLVLPGFSAKAIAIRIPSHPITRAIINAANCIIAAPSANISGRPSPTTASHVFDDFRDSPYIDLLLDGGSTEAGLESTVVSLLGDVPTLLRPGAVTPEAIEAVIGKLGYAPETTTTPISPGMKYRHYMPRTPLILLIGDAQAVSDKLPEYANAAILRTHNRSLSEVAKNLFNDLRHFDTLNKSVIVAEGVPEKGLGLAIMNRLKKAATTTVYLQD
ncbi:MAG: L-threonylcarbamoyladenylate synthase [Turicibacter sp.]|nr:L-threonylcarbamoyladenylate synthase [Turicibacter sp.]